MEDYNGPGREGTAIPHRAVIAQAFQESNFSFTGVTGKIDFSESRVANDKRLAILKIENIGDEKSHPGCECMIEKGEYQDECT